METFGRRPMDALGVQKKVGRSGSNRGNSSTLKPKAAKKTSPKPMKCYNRYKLVRLDWLDNEGEGRRLWNLRTRLLLQASHE